jgi:hypothetical protein
MIKKRRTKARVPRGLPVNSYKSPENYLSYSFAGEAVGAVTAGSPNATIGLNNYIMNGGAQMAMGTGTPLRLGRHVFLTGIRIRLSISALVSAPLRIIVGRSPDQDIIAAKTTWNQITSYVESNILEAYQQGPSTPNVIYEMIQPSTEYQIMYDKTFGNGIDNVVQPSSVAGNTISQFVDCYVPLLLPQTYDISGNVDKGDWFLYICSNASSGTTVSGGFRLEFINQWEWEDIPKLFKRGLSYVDDVYSTAKSSPAVRAILSALV